MDRTRWTRAGWQGRALPCLTAAACAGLVGCAGYVAQRAQSVLLETLPRAIGPADRYTANVQGANADATYFERVQVVGERVQRLQAPVIDRFEVDLQQVVVDRPNKRVATIGAASAVVQVTAADLTAYLARQSWIAEPRVRLSPPDRVEIDGRLKIPGLDAVPAGSSLLPSSPLFSPSASAGFSGRLVPNGSKLMIAIDAVNVAGRPVPALLRNLVEIAANPLFDLTAYAVPSTIDRVSAEEGVLVLQASGSRVQPAGAAVLPNPRPTLGRAFMSLP